MLNSILSGAHNQTCRNTNDFSYSVLLLIHYTVCALLVLWIYFRYSLHKKYIKVLQPLHTRTHTHKPKMIPILFSFRPAHFIVYIYWVCVCVCIHYAM